MRVSGGCFALRRVTGRRALFGGLLRVGGVACRCCSKCGCAASVMVSFGDVSGRVGCFSHMRRLRGNVTCFRGRHEHVRRRGVGTGSLELGSLVEGCGLKRASRCGDLKLAPVVGIFIHENCLSRSCCSCVSCFCRNVISLTSERLLLSVGVRRERPCRCRVSGVRGFIGRLGSCVFRDSTVLGVSLLSCFTSRGILDRGFRRMVLQLRYRGTPLRFLTRCCGRNGRREGIFKRFVRCAGS